MGGVDETKQHSTPNYIPNGLDIQETRQFQSSIQMSHRWVSIPLPMSRWLLPSSNPRRINSTLKLSGLCPKVAGSS